MEHDIESINYEQCLYSWSHVSQIYRKIKEEPEPDGGWTVQQTDGDEDTLYRRRGQYFQFFYGLKSCSLFQEFLDFEPMPTVDDAEWTVEKHGEGQYLVRTSFSITFGPSDAMQKVDLLIEPYGMWLEPRDTFVWGATTFGSLTGEDMWLAARRIVMLERWCIEANKRVFNVLEEFWTGVADKVSEEIATEGEPVLFHDPSQGKRREPIDL